MATRLCPQNHRVTDDAATFCPQCGQALPMLPPAPATETPEQRKARILRNNRLYIGGSVILVILVMTGMIQVPVWSDTLSLRPAPAPRPTAAPRLSAAEIKSKAKTVSYDALARNTESYQGSIVYYRGEVVQVQESSGSRAALRVNVTHDGRWWSDTVWVNYSGERLLDDDIIDLWGTVTGRRTYRAVLGNSITIPEIDALLVERRAPVE